MNRIWSKVELNRLADAWNSGVGRVDLGQRFGIAKNTITIKLREARAAGIKVIPREER